MYQQQYMEGDKDNKVGDKKLLMARIIRDIGKYVDKYNLCQRIKNRTEAPVEKLIVNKVSEKAQIYLTVNFITKLLLVAGKDTILVVYNWLSKMAYFIATIEEISVEELVKLISLGIMCESYMGLTIHQISSLL